MAISGAAASPNMGYYTSPATALFMTLFDVRLGWWMGNSRFTPSGKAPVQPGGWAIFFPNSWLRVIRIRAMFIFPTVDISRISAVYELIKRHCKVIVVCDAELRWQI